MKTPKPPAMRAATDNRRSINFTAKGTPRLSASTGSIERPATPPAKPKHSKERTP